MGVIMFFDPNAYVLIVCMIAYAALLLRIR